MRTLMICLVVCTVLAGCAYVVGREMSYLHSAKDRATQDEVREQFGPPTVTEKGPDGRPVWVYQVRDQQPGNRITAPGMWCDEYVLTFDEGGVLRQWTHKSFFHGGEFMPTYCVPGGHGDNPGK